MDWDDEDPGEVFKDAVWQYLEYGKPWDEAWNDALWMGRNKEDKEDEGDEEDED